MNYIITNINKLNNVYEEIKKQLTITPDILINLSWDKMHRAKTLSQLGFFFGGLTKAIQKHFEEMYGKEYETEIIKEMLYKECSEIEELICPNGETLYQHKRISTMTVKEMSEFIEKVIDFCDEYGIILQPELKYLWINNLNPRIVAEVEQYKFPEKDAEFLNYVRKETCLICGKGNVEAHHMKIRELSALGEKTPDWCAIPLCPHCHRELNYGGHIDTETIIRHCKFIFDVLTPKQFLKMRYERWINHK